MYPDSQLAIVEAFTGFLLKASLGLCICWAISKALLSPHKKFLVWFGFLAGAAFYWLWLAGALMPHGLLLRSLPVPAQLGQSAPVGRLQVQASWASPLSILLRGLGVLYLAGLTYFLFMRIKKHVHLRWMLQFTYEPPETIEKLFRTFAESLRAANVRLLMLSGISSPSTFGWINPTILLPPLCLEQDERELEDIFRHELQHVQRRDIVFHAVALFCRALLFFHPAAWYAMRRMELESELACDLEVVGDSPEKRATYAECLVRFAKMRLAQEPTPWNLDFAGSSIQLQVRIRSILAETRKIPGWLLGLRAALGVALLAGFLAVAPSLFVALSYAKQKVEQPAEQSLPNSHSRARLRGSGTINRGQSAQNNHAFAIPASDVPTVVPIDSDVDAAQAAPQGRAKSPTDSDPMLKRRGDAASKSPSATSILLLNSRASDSADSAARRASVASAISAGVSEAARVASHGHDKDAH